MFNIKLEGIEEAKKFLNPDKVHRAAARAINRAVDSAKTHASKEIRSQYNLPKVEVDKRMETKKATTNNLRGELIVTGQRLGLVLYGARQTKKGVSVAVIKGQRKLLHGAFIAPWRRGESAKWVFYRQKLPSSHQRKYRGGRMHTVTRVAREPREVLLGPSVPQVFKQPRVIEAIKQRTTQYVAERFQHELDRELKRR